MKYEFEKTVKTAELIWDPIPIKPLTIEVAEDKIIMDFKEELTEEEKNSITSFLLSIKGKIVEEKPTIEERIEALQRKMEAIERRLERLEESDIMEK